MVLERLTEDQIQRLTSASDRPGRTQKQIAKNFLRDVPRVDFGLFAQYKRSRQKFIERKKNARERSAEIGDFGFSSGEDVPTPPSDDDYVPEEDCSYSKRKRKAYEDDDDWSPDGKFSPRPKKTLRNLRVNTRRKRIESNSSSDEFENAFEDDKLDAAGECFGSKEEEGVASSLIDADLLSNIMREMEDFNQGKAPKSAKREGSADLESGFREFSRSRQKRRISRVIKITDELTPSIKEVQNIVRNMVNTVCSYEMQKIQAAEKSKKRTFGPSAGPLCKWCDIPFQPGNREEELCKVCKDVVKLSKSKTSSSLKRGRKPKAVKPGGIINKIKSKMLKKLPKYEQRRLMYGEKVSTPPKHLVGQQDGPEKTLVAADVHPRPPSPSDVTIPAKKKKLKKGSHLSSPKTKVIKSKKRKIGDVGDLTPLKPGQLNKENNKSGVDKSVNKDLLRINFPSDETSNQTIALKQPAANNVQYGTYLLPPIPTVVVANYAATDKNGDYYLSSVYYQNEMTKAKNVPGKNESNIAVPKANSLPSMPSMDQLSITLLDQLTSIPSISFTQSGNLTSVPNVSSGCSVDTKVVDSMSFANQTNVGNNKSEYNPYSDLGLLLNNPNLQIQPVEPKSSNVALNSDIASLFANSQLQIEPIIPSDEDNAMETDEPLEENNVDTDNECHFADMPPKELENSESASDDTVPPKAVDKSKETKKSLKNKSVESNNTASKEPPEEEMSSEALFRKMSAELDAIGILGVVDLDKNPRFSLERIMETNKVRYEQLQGMKPVTKDIEAKLKQAEDNRVTLQMAKTLLKTFGCFTNLSNSCLRSAKILQIKQEKQDPDDEEETRSSCQFAQQSQSSTVPAFVDVMGQQQQQQLDYLSNIETQLSSIAPIDPSQYGTVHHFPMSESRETPSRGSGPLTPARPESAISTTSAAAEEPALTPLQIKKERMEASEISPSQCSFATPSPARTPVAQSHPLNPFVTPSPSPHQQNSSFATPTSNSSFMSPSSNNVYQQSNPPAYPGNNSQDTFQILNEMTQRLQNVGQRNIAPTSNQQTHQLNNNQQMQQMNIGNQQNMPNLNNQQMGQPGIMHYQPQGSSAVPPNVTAPTLSSLNNQTVSKVLLNFARRQAPQNANYIFKNGGQIMNIQQQQNPMFKNAQMVNVQQQQSPNDVMFKNTQMMNVQQQQNPSNVMFKNTQMVNVQQVYLPSAQTRLQAGNQGMGQYNLVQPMSQGQIVQQGQQQVLVNSAGQQGQYAFQGGQQMQMQRVNLQQNNQVAQQSQNQAFMVQNNNRVRRFGFLCW